MAPSFWLEGRAFGGEAPADLPDAVDVAIVGAGYTGLWTAYYLQSQQPSLDIALFEAEHVGFGASGRNGGWCSAGVAGLENLLEDPKRRAVGLAWQAAMRDAVDEVGRVCQAENIDCHYHKGGNLLLARTPHQARLLQASLARRREHYPSEADPVWLPPAEAEARMPIAGRHGAVFSPHCAALQPALLALGLAARVTGRGARLFENTPISRIEAGAVYAGERRIRADTVIRATEGYTDTLAGERRRIVPIYSVLTATEPLPPAVWAEIGLANRETFGDARRVVIYGQRTLDNRLVFGARGAYLFGSRRLRGIPAGGPETDAVREIARTLFPVLREYPIDKGWGGFLGVASDFAPVVHFDSDRRIGWAGGYVGQGVAASNLAGRTLAELIVGQASERTALPWVRTPPRKWPIEPLRFIGAESLRWLASAADRAEERRGEAGWQGALHAHLQALLMRSPGAKGPGSR